jgi:hypothetical protein
VGSILRNTIVSKQLTNNNVWTEEGLTHGEGEI